MFLENNSWWRKWEHGLEKGYITEDDTWALPSELTCKIIGTASPDCPAGVVLASFTAD